MNMDFFAPQYSAKNPSCIVSAEYKVDKSIWLGHVIFQQTNHFQTYQMAKILG